MMYISTTALFSCVYRVALFVSHCHPLKVSAYTFRESHSLFLFLPSILLRITSKRKKMLLGSKVFPLREDPSLKGLRHPGKQTGSNKSFLRLKKNGGKHEVYSYTLICQLKKMLCILILTNRHNNLEVQY